MKKKYFIGGGVLIIVVVIILWITVFGKNGNGQSPYRTEAVSRGDIEALVVSAGTINPVKIVEVGSQVSGRISEIYVDFNSLVKAGQVVAELDQSLYITRVNQNEANYSSAVASVDRANVTLHNSERQYQRSQELFAKNLISYEEKDNAEANFLSAKSDVKSAEARLEQARSQLESSKVDLAYTVIKSPIDGVVISREVNVGQTVAASFQAPVLFKIANDLSKMQVECSIDEADIGKVKEGQAARFTVDAFANETFAGTVTQVRYSPVVTSNVVTYTAIVSVENPEMKLRPGLTATVSIVTGEAKNALMVPNSALRYTPDIPAAEMQKIMMAEFESMRAKREAAEGGKPGEKTAPAENAAGQGGSAQRPAMIFSQQGSSGPGGSSMSPEMIQRMRQSGRGRQMARVWVEDNGQLRPIFLRTGVTDNAHTEVKWGELKEGQLVIVGTSVTTSFGPPRMGFMMR